MLPGEDMPLEVLEERVEEAVRMLRLLANERRLMVLCHLLARGEMNVGSLADLVGLGCGAAIPMLRAAQGFLAANPQAVVATVAARA